MIAIAIIALVAFVIGFFVGNAHGWNVAADIGDKDVITERSRRVCAERTAEGLMAERNCLIDKLKIANAKNKAAQDALA